MKLRLILASCVIALSACATTADNGKFATDANIIQGTDAAVQMAQNIYVAGAMTDAQAQMVIDAANAILGFVKAHRAAVAAGDKETAASMLRAAADALDVLNARLLAMKGKK